VRTASESVLQVHVELAATDIELLLFFLAVTVIGARFTLVRFVASNVRRRSGAMFQPALKASVVTGAAIVGITVFGILSARPA